MDPVKILKRAWHILWSYRVLWVFGLILAIAGAGTHGNNGSNNGAQYETDSQSSRQPMPEDMKEAFKDAGQEMQKLLDKGLGEAGLTKEDVPTLIWIVGIFVLFSVLLVLPQLKRLALL
ncbi:MAG TPA: hypothetical protein PK989_14815 [Anaerolineales bacterium]|nr:hypothetical protein [Anaerolineales bacterium]